MVKRLLPFGGSETNCIQRDKGLLLDEVFNPKEIRKREELMAAMRPARGKSPRNTQLVHVPPLCRRELGYDGETAVIGKTCKDSNGHVSGWMQKML